jgi:small-conductance mechanosensitive channel
MVLAAMLLIVVNQSIKHHRNMPYTNLKLPIIAILSCLALLQVLNIASSYIQELLYIFLAKSLVTTMYISFFFLIRELTFFESILFDSEETDLFMESQEQDEEQRVKDSPAARSDSTSSSNGTVPR